MATTNTTKMTKASAFSIALELVNQSAHPDKVAVAEKIAKEIENLGKKNSNSGKPTKAQQENALIAQDMAEWMADQPDRLFSITELSKECPAVLGFNPQKIRPMLTGLIKSGQVERTEGKGGKPMFQFVGEVED